MSPLEELRANLFTYNSITSAYMSIDNHRGNKPMNINAETARALTAGALTPEKLARDLYDVMSRIKTYAENGYSQTHFGSLLPQTRQKLNEQGYTVIDTVDRDGDPRHTISW